MAAKSQLKSSPEPELRLVKAITRELVEEEKEVIRTIKRMLANNQEIIITRLGVSEQRYHVQLTAWAYADPNQKIKSSSLQCLVPSVETHQEGSKWRRWFSLTRCSLRKSQGITTLDHCK
uniref:ORFX n=1 Tax=Bottlenose dolphin astrovirus 3 TaxID=943154 RepID=F1D7Z5_9VIRU|nr:ORFX [Bottlenose dolphin astrovirus 3]